MQMKICIKSKIFFHWNKHILSSTRLWEGGLTDFGFHCVDFFFSRISRESSVMSRRKSELLICLFCYKYLLPYLPTLSSQSVFSFAPTMNIYNSNSWLIWEYLMNGSLLISLIEFIQPTITLSCLSAGCLGWKFQIFFETRPISLR